MKQEVIEDFLHVAGIMGVALMDGQTAPFFHGFDLAVDMAVDLTQQNAIAQNIQQVLETTPEGFNSFEFAFDLYRIYLHKLNQGITLLVLTRNHLPRLIYTQSVRRLLIELQIDEDSPITKFRSIAAGIVLEPPNSPPESSPGLASSPVPSLTIPAAIPVSSSNGSAHPAKLARPDQPPDQPIAIAAEPPPAKSASSMPQPVLPVEPELNHSLLHNQPHNQLTANPSVDPSVDLRDMLAAINALSRLTAQYLGTMVVANYWKSTRPAGDWINHFQIERSAQMTFIVKKPSERLPILTAEQHRRLQAWVAAFIERCSKVIRNFVKIVRQTLDQQQKALLFDPP